MDGSKEINNYVIRTYNSANVEFEKARKVYLDIVKSRSGESHSLENYKSQVLSLAVNLGLCCELYLKTLYVYEKRNSEKTYDELSNDVKKNGHNLNKLYNNMSGESQEFLKNRIIYISMSETEDNNCVDIVDFLLKKELIELEPKISNNQFKKLLEKHKNVFVEARYQGEKDCDVNIEFLYHLAKQIRAVVQYELERGDAQPFEKLVKQFYKIQFDKEFNDEFKKLVLFYRPLLLPELCRLILESENKKEKINEIIVCADILPKGISRTNFYNLIKMMSFEEIEYIYQMLGVIKVYCSLKKYSGRDRVLKDEEVDISEKVFKFIGEFKTFNEFINFCCGWKRPQLKGNIIGNDFFELLYNAMEKNDKQCASINDESNLDGYYKRHIKKVKIKG